MKRTIRRDRSPSRISCSPGAISEKYLPVAGSICSECKGTPEPAPDWAWLRGGDECQRGLEQLNGLLSHVDPHMTLGQLVGRAWSERDSTGTIRGGRHAVRAPVAPPRMPTVLRRRSDQRRRLATPRRRRRRGNTRIERFLPRGRGGRRRRPSPLRRRSRSDTWTASAFGGEAVGSAHFHHYFGAEVAARRWRSRQTRRARRAPTRIEPSGRIGGSPCSRRRPGRYFGVRLHSGPRTTSAERK